MTTCICNMGWSGDPRYRPHCPLHPPKSECPSCTSLRAVNKAYEEQIAESAAVYAERDRHASRCAELEKENGRLREGIVRLYSTIEKDAVSGVGNAGYYIRIMASMDGGNFLRRAANADGKEGPC